MLYIKSLLIDKYNKSKYLYIIISIFMFLINVFIFALSDGKLIDWFFFRDERDTWMDFYHSIEFVHGNSPYLNFGTLYPPLANLLYRFLYVFISPEVKGNLPEKYVSTIYMRNSSIDLRTYQSTNMLLFMFFLVSIFLLIYIVNKYIPNNNNLFLCLSIVFSYGFIYAIERGNIVVISMLLSAVFLYYRKSTNRVCKEIGGICLALSAGLKLYPALIGLILIKDKDYHFAIRVMIYGILSFVLPMMSFEGGFVNNCISYINVLSTSANSKILTIQNFINLHSPIFFSESFLNFCKYILVIILIVGVLTIDNEVMMVLYLSVSIYYFSGQYSYITCFFILPLLLFLRKNERINKDNIIVFVILTMMTVSTPIYVMNKYFSADLRMYYYELFCLVVTAYCISNMLKNFVVKLKNSN